MTKGNLRNLISRAPTGPGIYIFTGPSKKKLYIGKASNTKTRLLSYLKTADGRILQMLSRSTGIKTIKTDSEIEALILESQHVKRYQPSFNIMLRDDKQFFCVGFTDDTFQKLFLTHQPTPFGPFTDGTALKTTLKYLRRIFPYCTCKKPHNNYCLNYHIGKCLGFCCLKQQSRIYNFQFSIFNEYQKNIKAIKDILSGKKTSLLKNLEKEMVVLGKKERFEEAIELKNKIEKINRVFENARIIKNPNFPYYDISKNHNKIVLTDLKRIAGFKKIPARIEGYDIANIQGKYAVGAMVVFTLRQNSGQANWKPDKDKYRRFRIRNSLSAKRLALGDTAMLKEILTRRFNHPEWQAPDLILVDGGKQQLHVAEVVVNSKFETLNSKQILNSKFQIPKIVALTKNEKHKGEKIFISGRKNSVPLSRLPVSVKNPLLHINSEAHRSAVSYHRWLHRRAIKW